MHISADIWPEVCALCFGLILSLCLKIKYSDATEANAFYRQMVYAVTAAAFVDLLSISVQSMERRFFPMVYMLLTTLFYAVTLVASYCLLRYITMRAERQNGRFFRAQKYVLFADLGLLALNLFLRVFFTYDETGNMTYGTLHLPVCYGVAVFFLLSACVVQGMHKGRYTLLQRVILRFSGIFMLSAFVIQFFFLRDFIFSYAVGILCVYLIFFAVEMPVYRAVEETTGKLEETRKEAEEAAQKAHAASRAKSNFLASTSHEIRTPMNAIMGINELIGRGTSDQRMKNASEEIRDAGFLLLQIINDVLDYSRIESGRMELVQSDYRLSDILIETERSWAQVLERKKLSFSIRIADDVPDELCGDQDKVRQILSNLISNAVKYTDEGEVRISVSVRKEEEGQLLCLAVEDTGVGIRTEEIDTIFSLFSRAALEENRNRPGAGLGLRITEDLAHIMSGSVHAESVYGKGSRFILEIPLQKGEGNDMARTAYWNKAKTLYQAGEKAPFLAPDKRVLFVDDTVVNLTVARGLVEPTRVLVDAAMSGMEALALMKRNRYDMVFLDHMMPEIDGIETLRRLRAIPGYEQGKTGVIALTSNTGEGARTYYLAAGFDDYLPKPMKAETLLLLMRRFLFPENDAHGETTR